jgi:hypothetical protein
MKGNNARLQCNSFTTKVTAPGKSHKPKLWGFHKARNANPSLCIVRDATGTTLRIVKSVKVR